MKTSNFLKMALMALPLVLASCGSKKVVQQEKPVVVNTEDAKFLDKVKENAVSTKFITSKVKFTVEVGAQNITLTGNLKMKRDDVIRLQLMAFGFVEAGRLEFTKDYVLIMDRINKLYLKVPYVQVDFLRNSNIDFNVLQGRHGQRGCRHLNGRRQAVIPLAGRQGYCTPEHGQHPVC